MGLLFFWVLIQARKETKITMRVKEMIPNKIREGLRKFQLNLYWLLRLRPSFIMLDGTMKMFLDKGDSVGYSLEEYEPFAVKIIKKHIKKGDVVIDGGASLGYFTLRFADIVGSNGEVFAFEPNGNNIPILLDSINENKFNDRVRLIQAALTDTDGEGELFVAPGAGSSVMYDEGRFSKVQRVKTQTIDSYFANKRVDFIKLDIDGSEFYALKGAKETIQNNPNIKMLVEFSPQRIIDTGHQPEDVINLLKEYGFKIFCVSEGDKNLEEGVINVFKLCELNKEKTRWGHYVNLLCIKEKKEVENDRT